jgi:NitT/TauT family transport system ATP-binding protein
MAAIPVSARRPELRVRELRKQFPAPTGTLVAVESVSFTTAPGEFLAIVGPSGCGKSTLLQMVAGLLLPTAGEVTLGAQPVTQQRFDVIYIFQQYTKSILPWCTVRENVQLGLEARGFGRQEMLELCREYIHLVGLTSFGNYYPRQLSGGMQQRVAIARALVCQPKVLLMDEPFSSVDAVTRVSLQELTLRLWDQLHPTVLFVTHDLDEAVYLAQRVLVLRKSPSVVLQEHSIDLPYPRHPLRTRELPQFLAHRHALFEAVFSQGELPELYH